MRQPVLFLGHGSPMIALEDNQLTQNFKKVGQQILDQHGKPKAILVISAHWYINATATQKEEQPEQIYDFYGFPQALYELSYPAVGSPALGQRLSDLLGQDKLVIDNSWGIDHGSWTVLCHLFPQADIPIVQLSVNYQLSEQETVELGKQLAALSDEGVLIIGSGNVVHNLRHIQWDLPAGTTETRDFDGYVKEAILAERLEDLVDYGKHPAANYAVPTNDHYRPMLYAAAAGHGRTVQVFNEVAIYRSLSMTSYVWGGEFQI